MSVIELIGVFILGMFLFFILALIFSYVDDKTVSVLWISNEKNKRVRDSWAFEDKKLYPNGTIREVKKFCWYPTIIKNRFYWGKIIKLKQIGKVDWDCGGDGTVHFNTWKTLNIIK